MRAISTKTHGVLDYITGTVLMSTRLLPYFKNKPEVLVPSVSGLVSTLYSLFTRYELGAVKKLPMKIHLSFDLLSGAMMAMSPFIFGFYKRVWLPHVLIGAYEFTIALLTSVESRESITPEMQQAL